MKPIRCYIGFHKGNIVPAYEVDEDVDHPAFRCSRCGKVLT
jgi:hypothetical protein